MRISQSRLIFCRISRSDSNGVEWRGIKYFIFGNEPNHEDEVGNYTRWKKGYLNLHKELSKRGLMEKVKLVGPDIGMPVGREEKLSRIWFKPGVIEFGQIAAAYDLHRYQYKKKVRAGRVVDFIKPFRDIIFKHDPSAAEKPLILGEMG